MQSTRQQFEPFYIAALGLLAAYGLIGAFGNALHGFLPCSSSVCGSYSFTSDAYAEQEPEPRSAQINAAGPDCDECLVCTLLAKYKTGRAEVRIVVADRHIECFEYSNRTEFLSSALILPGMTRGPPRA